MSGKLSKIFLLLMLLFWSGVFIIFGQSNTFPITPGPLDEIDIRKDSERAKIVFRQNFRLQEEMENLRRRIQAAEERDRKKVEINSEDADLFKDFLYQSRGGLLRLHDFANCKNCPDSFSDKASAYSFGYSVYAPREFSHITFENNSFHLKGINSLGFLTNLGDVPLEKTNLTDKGIKELAEFEPSDQIGVIEQQFLIVQKGFQVGDFIYKLSSPVKENSTYVFRAIRYTFVKKSKNFPKKTDKSSDAAQKTDNSFAPPADVFDDIIVAFRIIRKHDDGSVTLLWKMLQAKASPPIVIE